MKPNKRLQPTWPLRGHPAEPRRLASRMRIFAVSVAVCSALPNLALADPRAGDVMILRRVIAMCMIGALMVMTNDVKAEDEADHLRAIERDRLRSLVAADLATARRLHADDFQLINPRGGTLSKDQYLADVASGDLDYLEWEPGDIQVRLYGDSAVIRYQAHLRVSVRGSPGRPVTFWHTDLYEKRNAQWQVVWSHATQVQE